MKQAVVILGAGGHGRVLLAALRRFETVEVIGFTDSQAALHQQRVADVPVIGSDDDLRQRFKPQNVLLANGVGGVSAGAVRAALFERLRQCGYRFINVIHPQAIVGDDVQLGEGVQIMAGAVVQSGAKLGDNVIVNSGAVVEHDCRIADHVHIASGATLAGSVLVADGTHIGAGATVIQNIQIGAHALVAAGAVVVRNVAAGTTVMGVPARVCSGEGGQHDAS